MLPYFLLVILPLAVWAIRKKYCISVGNKVIRDTRTRGIDVFMIVFLILLSLRGLRCGNDTNQYFNLYKTYSSSSFLALFSNYEHEIGYKLLNKFISLLGGNYQVLLCITAVISGGSLWFFYKRESENSLLTIALFLSVTPFMLYFSGIRQAVAMAFCIPAWYAAKNKKLFRFIVIVFLAMQFHNSAFMIVFIYPLYQIKIAKKQICFVIPLVVLIYVFKTQIFSFLFMFLWKEYDETSQTGAIATLLLLILFAVYAYFITDEEKMDQDTIAMRNFLILSIVIQIFAALHPLSMRMNYYFLIFIPVLIPKIANRSSNKYTSIARLSVAVMTVYFMCNFIGNVINDNDALNIFPYIPFWENGVYKY